MKCDKCGYDWGDSGDSAHACAFYQTLQSSTHEAQPLQRTWVGLTDEEVIKMSRYDLEYAALIGEVQRRLKEKNT